MPSKRDALIECGATALDQENVVLSRNVLEELGDFDYAVAPQAATDALRVGRDLGVFRGACAS